MKRLAMLHAWAAGWSPAWASMLATNWTPRLRQTGNVKHLRHRDTRKRYAKYRKR